MKASLTLLYRSFAAIGGSLAIALPTISTTTLAVICCASQAEAASNSRQLLQQARSGDVDAMRRLAKALWTGTVGRGVDRHNAIKWWKKAAEKGDSRSMVILGDFYAQGIYFDKNIDKALSYYKRAIKAGNKTAGKHYIKLVRASLEIGDTNTMCLLGDCYLNGYGVPVNTSEAYSWYQKAAAKGNKAAGRKFLGIYKTNALSGSTEDMFKLAEAYEKGSYGVAKKRQALLWYSKAAYAGHAEAALASERLRRDGVSLCSNNLNTALRETWDTVNLDSADNSVTTEEVTLTCLRDSVQDMLGNRRSDFDALLLLSRMLAQKVSEDPIGHQRRASEGNIASLLYIGHACIHGLDGVQKNHTRAFEIFDFLRKQENMAGGAFGLPLCYYYGFGVQKNHSKVAHYYEELAQLESSEAAKAHWGLACCYRLGEGKPCDLHQALQHLQKASNMAPKGYWSVELGMFYLLGLEVEQNNEVAISLIKESESIEAYYILGCCYLAGIGVKQDVERGCNYLKRVINEHCPYDDQQSVEYAIRLWRELSKRDMLPE